MPDLKTLLADVRLRDQLDKKIFRTLEDYHASQNSTLYTRPVTRREATDEIVAAFRELMDRSR